MSKEIQELNLEEVMGDRFGRYSKYIIQDRALPDIRDGLKPVQRRILYAMFNDGNTSDKPFRKSAKTVGNVIGNYHPHGDTSVYEAMIRMSQDWKNNIPLVEMHGNNGSMDGDPAAAMRYTEARLSKEADELLRDLDKETIDTVLNFDDTEEEPTVLPAGFPNLLVNGGQGISAGYATEIPTHNLGEVIEATIYLIDHPNTTLKKLMTIIPGPDFPTGGIIQGKQALAKAYKTGKGKVVLRSKTEINKTKSGREQIIITEIPFEVNKAELVRRMDELRLDRKIDGVMEVRDESDRSGLRIVIELKKDANAEQILQYYYKKSNLQINYNFNMVAIHDLRPKQVGLKEMLQAYIDHRQDVVTRRTKFLLKKDEERLHIIEGLIKAISILDDVIAVIRKSENKKDAKTNLQERFGFSERQAESIVSLQLYRLTNTDIVELQQEQEKLLEESTHYHDMLDNPTVLLREIKKALREIKKKYAHPRLTQIEDKIEELHIERELLIPDEQVMVVITRGGYVKRTPIRSFQSSKFEDIGLREGDNVLYLNEHSTTENLIFFTNKGNYIYQPVYELQELKWKDLGEHLSQRISLKPDEEIIKVLNLNDETSKGQLLFVTRRGQIKRTSLSLFQNFRGYKRKSQIAMPLADALDEVVKVIYLKEDLNLYQAQVLLLTKLGYALRYPLEEVSEVGLRAKGVKAINLKKEDELVGMVEQDEGKEESQVILFTQRGSAKRMRLSSISVMSRAKRGLLALRKVKSNPYHYLRMEEVSSLQQKFELYGENGSVTTVTAIDIPIAERESNGTHAVDEEHFGQVLRVTPLIPQLW